MKYPLGTAFRNANNKHVYFIVAKSGYLRAALPLATFGSEVKVDDSCIIYPGDHPFVQHRTYVAYKYGLVKSEDWFDRHFEERIICRYKYSASPELVFRILERAAYARAIENDVKQVIEAQYLELLD